MASRKLEALGRAWFDAADRAVASAGTEPVLAHLPLEAMRATLQARTNEIERAELVFMPARAILFRRYLPGGYPLFALVSELSLHPGPATTLLLSDMSSRDQLFWLSTIYSLYVSVVAEFAMALSQDAWIHELGDAIEAADPVVRTAWPDDYWPELSRTDNGSTA